MQQAPGQALDCELLRRFRQQSLKSPSEIQSLGLSASFESCWDTAAPGVPPPSPHRPATARLPARSFLNCRSRKGGAQVCVPGSSHSHRAGRRRRGSVQNSHEAQLCYAETTSSGAALRSNGDCRDRKRRCPLRLLGNVVWSYNPWLRFFIPRVGWHHLGSLEK